MCVCACACACACTYVYVFRVGSLVFAFCVDAFEASLSQVLRSRAMRACACLGYLAATLVVVAMSCDSGVVDDKCYQLLLALWILKASHRCCMCITCNTHTPSHPSAADEAWHWPKRVLRIGRLVQ